MPKPKAEVTDITAQANEHGGHVSASGKVTQQINGTTSIEVTGNVGHSQSFHGHGGNTNWGVTVGVNKKF